MGTYITTNNVALFLNNMFYLLTIFTKMKYLFVTRDQNNFYLHTVILSLSRYQLRLSSELWWLNTDTY